MIFEVVLKKFIRIFYLPSGRLDSQLALAVDHIYIVWKNKSRRSIKFIASILGLDCTCPAARCSILRLNEKVLFNISQGSLSGINLSKSAVKSNSFILPKYNDFHLAIAKDAYVNTGYGVFNAEGIPFDGTFFTRAGIFVNGLPERTLLPNKNSCAKIDIAFFINELNLCHFGHSITDGLSSVFPLLLLAEMRTTPRIPIIINKQISGQKFDLFKIFHPDDINILIPGENCGNLLVERLVYAVPTMVNSGRVKRIGFVAASHSALVKKYLATLPEDGVKKKLSFSLASSKIYLSRSLLRKNSRQFVGESQLEEELVRLGWIICHPQQYSLKDQLDLLGSATRICGAQGSALHLLFGINPTPDLRVIILSPIHSNFNYINQMRAQGINHKILNCLNIAEGQEDKPPWLRNHQLISSWSAVSLSCLIDTL